MGIGDATPTGALQVAGDEVRIGDGDTGTVNYASGDGDLYVEDSLELDGIAYFSSTLLLEDSATEWILMNDDSTNDVEISFFTDTSNVVTIGIDDTDDNLHISASEDLETNQIMTFERSTQMVGIGTNDPSHELTVAGDINITDSNTMYYGAEGQQYYNGSCMIIKGPTSTLELC